MTPLGIIVMRRSYGAIVVAVLCVVIVLVIYRVISGPRGVHLNAEEFAKCCRLMEISVPSGGRPIMYYCATGGPDVYIYLKLEIPAVAYDDFIARSPFADIELSASEKFVSGEESLAW